MKKLKSIPHHSAFATLAISLAIVATVLASCNYLSEEEEEGAIVTIGQNTLRAEDVRDIVPEGTIGEDSAKIIDSYIRRWATDVLLYEKAKENVANEAEISRMVEDYRRSLTIHYYQQNMANSKVEWPSEEEAREYYSKHSGDFTLDRSVAKGLILKVPKNKKGVNSLIKNIRAKSVAKKMRQFDEKEMQTIEKYALKNAIYYNVFLDHWEVVKVLQTRAGVDFAEPLANGFAEIEDDESLTIIRFVDYLPAGATAPEEMMMEQAKETLYNEKRLEYLKNLGSRLYDDAVKTGKIKFRTAEEPQHSSK